MITTVAGSSVAQSERKKAMMEGKLLYELMYNNVLPTVAALVEIFLSERIVTHMSGSKLQRFFEMLKKKDLILQKKTKVLLY